MPLSILRSRGNLSPAEALELAQQAPEILRKNPKAISASPLTALFSATETAELWTIYENLLLVCLRTGNDQAAHQCLERLVLRFGGKDERIEALEGLIKEAEATNESELEQILKKYNAMLAESETNVPIVKRKVALLRSMGKVSESIEALISLLSFSPTDPESWVELGDIYLSQGLYPQAIFALEESLVLTPNAWNLHARLGEILLMAAHSDSEGTPQKYFAGSLKRFCRSIELCDNYLRGYYGLKRVTDELVNGTGKIAKQLEAEEYHMPEQSVIEKLNLAATKKLGEIVRRYEAKDRLWQGYTAGEVAAARELLAKSSPRLVR